MTIVRPYVTADREACLGLFDSNVPKFFDPSERHAFEEFLQEMRWPYQVVELDGGVAACGGHALEADRRTVSLCWGIVRNDLHGRGLGHALTIARLSAARACPGVDTVRLDTGVHTTGFYERYGFVVEQVIRDGYAPGSDRYEMRLRLAP